MITVVGNGTIKDLPTPNAKGTQITFFLCDKQKQGNGQIERQIKCVTSDLSLIESFIKQVDAGDYIVVNGELVQFKGEYLVKMTSFEVLQKAQQKEQKEEGQF